MLVGYCIGLVVGENDSEPFVLRVGFADGRGGELVDGSFAGSQDGF